MGSVKNTKQLTEIPASNLTDLKPIGEGGFGLVYRCQHKQLGPVALKKLKASFVQPRYVAKLKKEAEKLAELKHSNIVHLYGVVMEENNYGIVMEYVYHGSLDYFLERWRPVATVLKLHVAHQILTGMTFLHNPRPAIIHQDLKSLNILITHKLQAKIADFGLSEWRSYSRSFTSQKSLQGTVTHIPPERWANIQCKLSYKFDIYSFGILLWELLTEAPPYGNAPDAVIGNNVMRGQRPDHSAIPHTAPHILVNFMQASWKQDPDERPTFQDMKQQFEAEIASKETYSIELQREKASLFARVQEETANESGLPDKWMPHSLSTISAGGQHWYMDISDRLGGLTDWLGQLLDDDQRTAHPQCLQFLRDIQPKVRRTLDEPEIRGEISSMVEQFNDLELEADANSQNVRTFVQGLSQVLEELEEDHTISDQRTTAVIGSEGLRQVQPGPATKIIGDAHQPEDASIQEDGYISSSPTEAANPAPPLPLRGATGIPQDCQGTVKDNTKNSTGSAEHGEEVERLLRKIGVEPKPQTPIELPSSQHPDKPPTVPEEIPQKGGTVPWTETDLPVPPSPTPPALPPKVGSPKKGQSQAIPGIPPRQENPETDSEPGPRQETEKPRPSQIYPGNPGGQSSKGTPPSFGDGKKLPPKSKKKGPAKINFGPGALPPDFMQGFNIDFSSLPGNSAGGQGKTVFNIANVDGVQIGDRNIMYVGNIPKGAPNPWGPTPRPGATSARKVSSAQLTKSTRILDGQNMDFVAKHLGREWRRVARRLGFSEGQVDAIANDYHLDGLYEQIYQMLQKWMAREGNQATLASLAAHLWDAGKHQLALHIKER